MEGTPITCPLAFGGAVVHGRAFHKGDVVILQANTRLSDEQFARFREEARSVEQRSGLEFVLIDSSVTVIEGATAPADGVLPSRSEASPVGQAALKQPGEAGAPQ